MQQVNLLTSLEIENYGLKQKLNACSSETSREICDLKELYDSRLEQLKLKIKDLSSRKEAAKVLAEHEQTRATQALERLAEVTSRHDSLNRKLTEVFTNKSKCQYEFDLISMRAERCELELPRLRKHIETLSKQVSTVKRQLASESACRVRLEHNYAGLARIEEHQFKLHETNKLENDKLCANVNNKKEEINNNCRSNCNLNLLDELEKVKLKTLVKIKELEPRIEFVFKTELEVFRLKSENSDLKELNEARAHLEELKLRLDESRVEYEFLKSKKERYEERIKRLESLLDESTIYYDVNLSRRTRELSELSKQLNELREDYLSMLTVKENAKKQIDLFYDELHVKGILFQFYNLRNGKKLKFL